MSNTVLASEKNNNVRFACVVIRGDDSPICLTSYLYTIIEKKRGKTMTLVTSDMQQVFAVVFSDCPLSFVRAASRGNPISNYYLVCIPESCSQTPRCQAISKRIERKQQKSARGG